MFVPQADKDMQIPAVHTSQKVQEPGLPELQPSVEPAAALAPLPHTLSTSITIEEKPDKLKVEALVQTTPLGHVSKVRAVVVAAHLLRC